MHRNFFIVTLVLVLLVSACLSPSGDAPAPTISEETDAIAESASPVVPEAGASGDLVIYSGRSEPLIQPVIDAFKAEYPDVNVLLKAGSNSELANALIEEQANPQADVFIATELFTIQALAQQDIFQSYLPDGVEQLPAEFIGPDNEWVGLTRRARVIMYNSDLVSPDELPSSIFDLTDPRWKGQVAAAGSTNGSMQAQIAAMRQLIGEEATEEWLSGLIANDAVFFGGHTDVRKAVGTGEFKLGLVNHYYFYLQQVEGSNVGIIFPDQGEGQIGLITNATSAAIVKEASNLPAAQAFIAFLVSAEGQRTFADLNYEYPILPGVMPREGVQPLDNFRLSDVDIAQAALEFDATFDLMEKVGLP